MNHPQLSAALAEALAKAGKRGPAYSTICEAIEWAHSRGRALELPDLLHVKGEILLLESLQMARRQGLLSLELRSAISLAKLWSEQGEANEALELLGPIFSRFSEGFETPDFVEAAKLLRELRFHTELPQR